MQYGKRLFEKGEYKRALHEILPLAVDGNPEAQYAIGYMYYYGYGVGQDTETGDFWISRAAKARYEPAMRALSEIRREEVMERHTTVQREEASERETQETVKKYRPRIRYNDIKNMD